MPASLPIGRSSCRDPSNQPGTSDLLSDKGTPARWWLSATHCGRGTCNYYYEYEYALLLLATELLAAGWVSDIA